ncbi:NAD(P)H-binding protein [Nocardia sp. NPDC048505]|uniref:NAD(P)H-binding protein n=1 Tax=unclassified Nocardia TaxID=2637762 RepID=UPI0033E5D683
MKILVTGATGNIGRKVVDELLARGAEDVRALTNNPKKAALPPEVEVAEGFLGRPDSLPAAFEGVERLYLAPYLPTVTETVRLARAAGIAQIVDLSGDESTDWQPIAQAVEQSGCAWTHLYTGEFMENATMWAEAIQAGDRIQEPYPAAANAPIAMADIAVVAAVVLLGSGHEGQTYNLTGPETLTRAEKLQQIGAALDRKLEVVPISREEGIRQLTPSMGEYAEWYLDGMAAMEQHPQQATTTIADLTGAPATTFAQWARDHADEFRNGGR